MQMRPPSVPLITVDPYFSVWSPADRLTDATTVHWTGSPNTITAIAEIDGVPYRFMGLGNATPLRQTGLEIEALSTEYRFEGAGIELTARFTSPLIPDDLYMLSRPVSYLHIGVKSLDRETHVVNVRVSVSEEICLDTAHEDEVETDYFALEDGIASVRIGSKKQPVLWRDGDDVRIDWGYFYLSTAGRAVKNGVREEDGMTFIYAENTLAVKDSAENDGGLLFTFAYDDIASIKYFGDDLHSFWNRNGSTITEEIVKAHSDYAQVMERASAFSDRMFIDAVRAGGEKYAELLMLATRQVLAAHKLVLDKNGEVVYVSKECFSNGCACTVDVSYPSTPFFLIYNPELVRGMMRPIYHYARSEAWPFDFAPHDAGRYPLVDGQRYGANALDRQMPVEECGNMIIMEAAAAVASGDVSFARSHMKELNQWVKYLIENGADPANQLCTDDFAGHLAHNCNLSLKAVMGIAGLGIIYGMLGDEAEKTRYMRIAKDMAADWAVRASNGDGSYRLAFDRPGSYSMKYNIVWDKLFGTGIMPREVVESEFASYRRRQNPYGLPLDNRETYSKSDWLTWTGTLAGRREDFVDFITPLWNFYDLTTDRVPMSDWYWTLSGGEKKYGKDKKIGMQHRSVQGGLFIKLLEYKGCCKV